MSNLYHHLPIIIYPDIRQHPDSEYLNVEDNSDDDFVIRDDRTPHLIYQNDLKDLVPDLQLS